MKSRRRFLTLSAAGVMGTGISGCNLENAKEQDQAICETLNRELVKPVLNKSLFQDPVIIESLELLVKDNNFICKVQASSGAIGYSISNNMQMISLYPIFIHRLQPFFIGKEASDIENLLDQVYVFKSNYKLQNLALWVPLATIEFAILDMLGRISGKSMGALIGNINNPAY